MTTTPEREALIEKARVAYVEAWEAENNRVENWDRDANGTHSRSRAGIEAALAVFEESQRPSEEERETLRYDEDGLHIYWADTVEGCWVAFRRVDCVGEEELPGRRLPAGFRRPVSPSVVERHDLVMPIYDEEPQAEPTDAQVMDAFVAYVDTTGGSASKRGMRAALRAAFAVKGEGR